MLLSEDGRLAKKRKRYEGAKEKDLDARINSKLHQHVKETKRVAKKAKTFELQKLVKRLKTLRTQNNDPSAIATTEAELVQLKALDHEALARTALKSKLMKDKLLSGNEHIQAAIVRELQSHLLASASTSSAAKVQSRVLSSKMLAVEISNIIDGLRAVVIPAADGEEEDAPPRKVKKFEDTSGHDGDVEMASVDEDDLDATDDDENGWESGTVGDDEREPDDGWESGSLDGDMEEEGATDGTEDEADSQILSSSRSPPAKRAKQTNSTFLPSLSVGIIKGSDDSDWDDNDAKAGDIVQKKNRRGQRARQAIWEKKFGKNANHKKKEAQAEAEASRKREARRNNAAPSRGRFRKGGDSGQHTHRPDTGWGQRTDSRPLISSAQAPSTKAAETLHPSWEAKRRVQQQQAIVVSSAPSKKIKFT